MQTITYNMLAMLGWPEIAVICFVVLLLFGAKKLPELARGMGKGIREFKKASSDMQYELESAQYENEATGDQRKTRPAEEKAAHAEEKAAHAEVDDDKPGKAESTSEPKA